MSRVPEERDDRYQGYLRREMTGKGYLRREMTGKGYLRREMTGIKGT